LQKVGSGKELQKVGSGKELQKVGSGKELQKVGSGKVFFAHLRITGGFRARAVTSGHANHLTMFSWLILERLLFGILVHSSVDVLNFDLNYLL